MCPFSPLWPSNRQSLFFLIIAQKAFSENCYKIHANLYNKYRLLTKSSFSDNFYANIPAELYLSSPFSIGSIIGTGTCFVYLHE